MINSIAQKATSGISVVLLRISEDIATDKATRLVSILNETPIPIICVAIFFCLVVNSIDHRHQYPERCNVYVFFVRLWEMTDVSLIL